jgi:hypothetical protein
MGRPGSALGSPGAAVWRQATAGEGEGHGPYIWRLSGPPSHPPLGLADAWVAHGVLRVMMMSRTTEARAMTLDDGEGGAGPGGARQSLVLLTILLGREGGKGTVDGDCSAVFTPLTSARSQDGDYAPR